VRSVSTLLGIEAILVVKDACDNDPVETVGALRSAARAMVRGFLDEMAQN
jgi:hypothetical protein